MREMEMLLDGDVVGQQVVGNCNANAVSRVRMEGKEGKAPRFFLSSMPPGLA
jgi:hypothetical protein